MAGRGGGGIIISTPGADWPRTGSGDIYSYVKQIVCFRLKLSIIIIVDEGSREKSS